MRPLRALVAVFAALAASVVLAQAPLEGAALGDALKRGGYVIYFRHTSTDFSKNDAAMRSFEDCANQRNLTDAGRDEARVIGKAIAELGIPVGEVLASPYCRTMETARLIFGRATPTHGVRGGPASADGDRYLDLKALFARGAPAGTNVAIASHGNPFHAVAGPPYLTEGKRRSSRPGARTDSRSSAACARTSGHRWRRRRRSDQRTVLSSCPNRIFRSSSDVGARGVGLISFASA